MQQDQLPTSLHVFASVRLLTCRSLGTPDYGAPCNKAVCEQQKWTSWTSQACVLPSNGAETAFKASKSIICLFLRSTVRLMGRPNPRERIKQVVVCRRGNTLLSPKRNTFLLKRTGSFRKGSMENFLARSDTPWPYKLSEPGDPRPAHDTGNDGTRDVCSKSIPCSKRHRCCPRAVALKMKELLQLVFHLSLSSWMQLKGKSLSWCNQVTALLVSNPCHLLVFS